jgi:hypothetical protein
MAREREEDEWWLLEDRTVDRGAAPRDGAAR